MRYGTAHTGVNGMKIKQDVRGAANFADNLRELLVARDMTPMDVARMVNVSPSALSAILNKSSFPSIRTINLIASAFDVEGWWLCSEHFDPRISQVQINNLMRAATSDLLNESGLDEVIKFAEFKAG